MIPMRGLTVAVGDWYAATLAITLPRNMRHMSECVVVTSPDDHATKAVAASVPNVRIVESDAYRRHGARFNKGLMMEAGFDALEREGWILILDADILLPDTLSLSRVRADALHGCRRRILNDPSEWTPDLDWTTCPHSIDGGPIGFFQLFHASSPWLRDKRPWYDVSFAHAGGCDAYFMSLFPRGRLVMLRAMEVLHLGPKDTNWFGTDAASRDLMSAFVVRNGWTRSRPALDRTVVHRVGDIPHRVDVPGYEPSTFELPFVKRAKGRA